MSDLALRLAQQAHETATVAAEALTETIRALRDEQAARQRDAEGHARRDAAMVAEVTRLREQVAEVEGDLERTRGQLADARSTTAAAKAKGQAVAGAWGLVGEVTRSRRVRLAAVGVVAGAMLLSAVALWRAAGVDTTILSTLLGASNAPGPTP